MDFTLHTYTLHLLPLLAVGYQEPYYDTTAGYRAGMSVPRVFP